MGSKSAIMNLLQVLYNGMYLLEVEENPGWDEVAFIDNRLVFGHKLPRNRTILVDVWYVNDGHTHRKIINLWRHKPDDLVIGATTG